MSLEIIADKELSLETMLTDPSLVILKFKRSNDYRRPNSSRYLGPLVDRYDYLRSPSLSPSGISFLSLSVTVFASRLGPCNALAAKSISFTYYF